MNQIYIVVGLHGDKVEVCEAFNDTSPSAALGRAFQAATDMAKYAVSTTPNEETLSNGSKCWTFLNNGRFTVKVFHCEVADALTSSHSPAQPPYDFMDRSLPVGWFYDGKPALMSDLQDNPHLVKSPLLDLTEEQKWALIEVRVRKSPNFHSPIGTLDHTRALAALRGRTPHGLMLRDEEIEALHALREDQIAGTD